MRKKVIGIILATAVATGNLLGCANTNDIAQIDENEQSVEAENGVEEELATETDDSLARVQEAGVLKIGTEGTYPPYSYHDEEGNLIGFDVEISKLVAEKLGVEPEFVETKWDAMIAGLDAERFDVIANQVAITDERTQKYDFTEPYTYIHGALIVHIDNEDITTFEDIEGKRSAQTLTSNWAQTAEEYGAELVGVEGFEQSVELIASGRADVTLNSEVALYDYLKQKPDAPIKKVTLLEDASIVAFPIRKGETSLYEAVNEALLALREEGKLTELSIKYFGVDITEE